MSMIDIYIRDKQSGLMHRVGDDIHDMLTINAEGQLCYHNLQNGDGCRTGESGGGYEFIPNEDDHGYNCVPKPRTKRCDTCKHEKSRWFSRCADCSDYELWEEKDETGRSTTED